MDESDTFSGSPIKYSRDDFDKLLSVEQEKFVNFVNDFVKSQNVTWESCEGILLLGGSSLVPFLRELLRSKFPTKLLMSIHAEESVSKGATRYAASFLTEKLKIDLNHIANFPLLLSLQPDPTSTYIF